MSITNVFFDSDALIAGSASQRGASFVLLQLSELGLIQGIVSKKVIEECRKNIQNKLPDALPHFEQIIDHAVKIVDNPAQKELKDYLNMADEKDVPILVAAIQAKAEYLVTFNTKDYFPGDTVKLSIVKPGNLLKKIRIQLNEMAK
ncbi:MAG: PIN domain-containing protein [Balneolaceae bacterium]|nr:PIN domain-containing protein [Balneolaceae bacterium]